MKYHLYGKFDPFFNIMSKIFISCSIDANHYDFFVIVTNFGAILRSTVYWLRISDYCRSGTVPHLNIIVIIVISNITTHYY